MLVDRYRVSDRESCSTALLLVFLFVTMPPKSSRKRHVECSLKKAREAKSRREMDDQHALSSIEPAAQADEEAVDLPALPQMPEDALDTDDELKDPTFDLDASMKSDKEYITDDFCDNWILQLDKDDRVNLGIFLCFQLKKVLSIGCTKQLSMPC